MPYLSVPDANLYYEERGSSNGRPLLLLHAALQTADSMEPLGRILEEGFRIVVPDQRGHGRSSAPAGPLSLTRLADDAAGLLQHLNLQQPVVIGYSLGGMVAVELARRGLASGLAALAVRIRPVEGATEAFAPEAIARRSPIWAGQLQAKHRGLDWRQLAVELGRLLESWPGFGPDDLAQIRCPALVVQGDRDEMVPLEQARQLAASIPGAALQVVPRAGHSELLYRLDALSGIQEFVTGFR